ncbi:glycoside hydrolase family 88 protein [Edaphobacter flagellatus]|uniref:glycoside hydrolase family 88 protein n=1 Tax=Edaphobacter flagellatus TaxID=1933044 RepID=UPI0021B2B9DF|nr:glycoside hydrolase family 88 protein [Edaphobacter flagellatus]
MGWYLMALVDTLPHYQRDDPDRAVIARAFSRVTSFLYERQDQKTGLWCEIDVRPCSLDLVGDYMLIYAIAKGARLGYLPRNDGRVAAAWKSVHNRIASATSLSNERSGPIGAFLLAADELDMASTALLGRGERILLDGWFTSAKRKNAAGQMEPFHYKWDDLSDLGYSFFGNIFRRYGVSTEMLNTAPTIEALKDAQFYMIVSPDTLLKNPHPNALQDKDAEQITFWVKQGGVLIVMANDGPNTDIEGLNLLMDRFGLHFNNVLSHHVIGDTFPMGRLSVAADPRFFRRSHILYFKDTCTISLSGSTLPLLRDQGQVLIATAKYGKGTVLAVADPWLYNEYTDGRKLPREYDNLGGGIDMVRWLLRQVPN